MRAGARLKCTGCLAPAPGFVQHCHLPARDLLSLPSLLRAFLLTVVKRNQAMSHNFDAMNVGRIGRMGSDVLMGWDEISGAAGGGGGAPLPPPVVSLGSVPIPPTPPSLGRASVRLLAPFYFPYRPHPTPSPLPAACEPSYAPALPSSLAARSLPCISHLSTTSKCQLGKRNQA